MNISSLINAPGRIVTNCWQTVCKNKKTIAKTTAGVAVIALAAIIYSQRQSLYHMQDSLLEVARSHRGIKHPDEQGGGMSRGSMDMLCLRSYTPYKLEVNLSKSTPDVTGLLNQVKELYNNATSCGTDIFSVYGFHASRDSVSRESDIVKATFLICRSSFSNLFSAPWRG
jgi:hypothetical protein